MLNIPKLPDQEEFEYKKKEFFLSLYEQFQSSSKVFLFVFALLVVLAVPLKFALQTLLTRSLIAAYHPPRVNSAPYTPQDLEILKVQALPVDGATVSLLAQILNPNAEISVRQFEYEFVLKDEQGSVIKNIFGQSFIAARESKFIFEPLIPLTSVPARAELKLGQIRWTIRKPDEVRLEILQKNAGSTLEGKFFVEGLVKNSQGFGLKKIVVNALVFDARNQSPLAINETVLTELKPFESRYFRMIWPRNYRDFGEVQVIPQVNLLDPGLSLEDGPVVPVR